MPRLGALSPRGSQAEKINEARETWRRNCELRSGSRRAGGRRADPHPLSQAKPAVRCWLPDCYFLKIICI